MTNQAPRVKTFGSLGARQGNKARWDENFPMLKLRDFAGMPVEIRFVGSPYCQKVHTIYLSLDHARELYRHKNRPKDGPNKNTQPNIPRDAKAFDVICTDFDYIDERSYPNQLTGEYTCECCGKYAGYVKERVQNYAWLLYKDPRTQQWVPELKVLRFPSTVSKGIGEAAALITDTAGNVVEDIASLEAGATVYIKYDPNAAPAQMYSVQRGNYFPLPDDMQRFVQSRMQDFEVMYRATPQDPADTSRSLAHWKYPELLRAAVPGAQGNEGYGLGGSLGTTLGQATPSIPSASFQADAPPSFRPQAAAASTLTTFSSDDVVPSFGGGAPVVPSFGESAPAPVQAAQPAFAAATPAPMFSSPAPQPPAPAFLNDAPASPRFSSPTPSFMGSGDFGGAPVPPANRRSPSTSGF